MCNMKYKLLSMLLNCRRSSCVEKIFKKMTRNRKSKNRNDKGEKSPKIETENREKKGLQKC